MVKHCFYFSENVSILLKRPCWLWKRAESKGVMWVHGQIAWFADLIFSIHFFNKYLSSSHWGLSAKPSVRDADMGRLSPCARCQRRSYKQRNQVAFELQAKLQASLARQGPWLPAAPSGIRRPGLSGRSCFAFRPKICTERFLHHVS